MTHVDSVTYYLYVPTLFVLSGVSNLGDRNRICYGFCLRFVCSLLHVQNKNSEKAFWPHNNSKNFSILFSNTPANRKVTGHM